MKKKLRKQPQIKFTGPYKKKECSVIVKLCEETKMAKFGTKNA